MTHPTRGTVDVLGKHVRRIAEAGRLRVPEERAVGLVRAVGEQGDAYHMQPLYTSGGGYLFGTDAEGNQDPTDLGVGKEGSIAAAEKIIARYPEAAAYVPAPIL